MLIGTSMFVRPRRRAENAEAKNGRPAYAIAGIAISAETQCSNSTVAGPMPSSTEPCPAQMPIEISITFPAANPATASERSSIRPVRSCAAANARVSKGTRR